MPLVVLALFLAVVPSAMAAGPTTVTLDAGQRQIAVVASFGTANDVTIVRSGGTYRIEDSAGVTSATCTADGANAVVCTDPGSDFGSELDVRLRDQDDTLMLDAGADIDVVINVGDG